jgi:hypothetical protein
MGDALGHFEGVENLLPDVGRLFDAFHSRGSLAPRIVAVVKGLHTCGDNERVVFEAFAIGEHYALRNRIEIDNLTRKHARIFLAAEHASQRSRNFSRRQRSGRDLIQQRLKQVIVPPVNQRHIDGR